MILIRAIIRPDKVDTILFELTAAGYPAVTIVDAFGRGNQQGFVVGEVNYDEIPKVMLIMAVEDEDKDNIIKLIMRYGRTGGIGTYGDGRIFVSEIVESYSVRSGEKVREKEVE